MVFCPSLRFSDFRGKRSIYKNTIQYGAIYSLQEALLRRYKSLACIATATQFFRSLKRQKEFLRSTLRLIFKQNSIAMRVLIALFSLS